MYWNAPHQRDVTNPAPGLKERQSEKAEAERERRESSDVLWLAGECQYVFQAIPATGPGAFF